MCLRSNLWVVLSVSRVFALTILLFSYNALSSQSFKVGFSPSSAKVPSCFLWPTWRCILPLVSSPFIFLLGTNVFVCLLFCRALIYLHLFESKFYLSVVEHAFNPSTGGKLISMSVPLFKYSKARVHQTTCMNEWMGMGKISLLAEMS